MILNQVPIIQLVGGRNSHCLYILVAISYPNFPELSQPVESPFWGGLRFCFSQWIYNSGELSKVPTSSK